MTEIVRFALLGIGAGSVYALVAIAMVLMYRGSGVVNFATGAVGMVSAFVFYNIRADSVATPLALLLALGCGAAINVAFYLVVMRQLHNAPALTRVIATLGLLSVLYSAANGWWANQAKLVDKLLPFDRVVLWGDVAVQRDRLILFAIAVVLTALLAPIYKYTHFGRATTAIAQNRQGARCSGVSEDLVAVGNWALGGALAAAAAILIVNVSGLSIDNLTLLVIPASAAAVVGGFTSFGPALAGGLVIGILESELTYFQTSHANLPLEGISAAVPLIVILAVLVVRGRALPVRGELLHRRPPEIGTGRPNLRWLLPAWLVVCVFAFVASSTIAGALTVSAAIGIVCLSIVVLTGYAGQISLAQIGLAGLGGWFASKVVISTGSFELGLLVGVIALVPVGILVGLPAVRVRGINLAVVTLALSVFINAQFLDNARLTGGFTGLDVGRMHLFGISFDPIRHPERYAALAVTVLVAAGLIVANLRRGRAGRRLIAVRTNERAAAALGISVVHAKLYAFAVAAALAGAGGILLTFRSPVVTFEPTFSVFESVLVVLGTVLGGVGYLVGGAVGGLVDPNGLLPYWVTQVIGTSLTVTLVLGLMVLVQLIVMPDGIVHGNLQMVANLRARLRKTKDADGPPALAPAPPEPVPAMTLELRNVSVSFGGVLAADDVSFIVEPGTVVGLIGPNGAGKTTVIDAATGFVPTAAGTVLLNGREVTSQSARSRACAGLGRSFQSLELFDTMTVHDNLLTACEQRDLRAYVLDLVRPGHGQLSAAAVAAVNELALAPVLNQRTGDLAYGTRREVAIARAIAANPSVLLLDEPAAGLDEAETRELGRLLRRLADEWKMAILLVEHNVGLVMDASDRVVVLENGRVIVDGAPEDVKKDAAVARAYLGDEDTRDLPRTRVSTATRRPDEQTAPLLEAEQLVAGYGEVAAVRGIDLSVGPGEIVALAGPNGAGKSTTLATLAGALVPLGGEVRWRGRRNRAALHRNARDGLVFVPEERATVPGLTVDANLRLWRGDRDIAYDRFPALRAIQDRLAGRLSGGEQQMLALGCALSRQPSMLLVDELSLGLAPLIVRDLLATLRQAADDGLGVLLVEQHVHMTLEIADRIAVLDRGHIAFAATASEAHQRLAQIEDIYMGETTEVWPGQSLPDEQPTHAHAQTNRQLKETTT